MMKRLYIQLLGGTTSQLHGFYRGYILAKRTKRELYLDIASYSNGYYYPYAADFFNVNCKKVDYLREGVPFDSPATVPQSFKDENKPVFIDTNKMPMSEIQKNIEKHRHREVVYLMGDSPTALTQEFKEDEAFKKFLVPMQNMLFLDKFKEKIENQTSIGVFCRRAEYVNLGKASPYSFFQAGIRFYAEKYPDAVFYIFSDDLDDVKKHLGNHAQFRYVRLIGGADAHIEALLALANCDHRVIGRTLWSNWARFLATKENSTQVYDKTLLVEVPKASDRAFLFGEKEIEQYAEKNTLGNVPEPADTVAETLERIKSDLAAGKVEQASDGVISLSMDCFHVTKEQKDQLTSYFEEICGMKGEFLRQEQCLMDHWMSDPDSISLNNQLVTNKILRNKPLQACFYAARLCHLNPAPETLEMMKIMLLGTGYEDILEKLATSKKCHFVICGICTLSSDYTFRESLAIWLLRMGHTVSYLHDFKSDLESETENKYNFDKNTKSTLLKIIQRRKGTLSYKSVATISGYTVLQDHTTSRDSVGFFLDNLQEQSDLPVVFINRNVKTDTSAINVPQIYWDHSSPYDFETLRLKRDNERSPEEADKILCRDKPYVITTNPEKMAFFEEMVGENRVLCAHDYAKPYYEVKEDLQEYAETIQSTDDVLKFVIDVNEFVQKIIKDS